MQTTCSLSTYFYDSLAGMSIEINGSLCAVLMKEKMGCMMDLDGTDRKLWGE
jgi:hypothetical protein